MNIQSIVLERLSAQWGWAFATPSWGIERPSDMSASDPYFAAKGSGLTGAVRWALSRFGRHEPLSPLTPPSPH